MMNTILKNYMKHKLPLFLTCGLALSAMASAVGNADDPLISLSYLNGVFADKLDARIDDRLDSTDWTARSDSDGTPVGSVTAAWAEQRMNNGDTLQGSTGTNALLLAGDAFVTFSAGTVVDVTQGIAVPSGTALQVQHRYLVAEDTDAVFTVTSKTAVLDYQGPYQFTWSNSTDYTAMAGALKTLHLFQGSFTGYGQGYDLEAAPTRLQALIMFLRVLGEEDAALSWTGTLPFTDVDAKTQAGKYVGYAYEKGYTKGYSATTFRPAQTISSRQYLEFLLRALGYGGGTDLSSTFDRAVQNGVIGQNERAVLETDPFLRADLVYLSYYALDAIEAASSLPLSQVLQNEGVFTADEWEEARAAVTSDRIW